MTTAAGPAAAAGKVVGVGQESVTTAAAAMVRGMGWGATAEGEEDKGQR
jgi:hypothetical protein